MNLRERINKGIEGSFEGLDNGLERVNDYIFGVQRKTITLIGGQSGCFKTTMLDFIVQHAIQDAEAKGIKLNLFYNSFEIDKLSKQCNWLSVQIFSKYGVIIAPEVIKGLGKNRLTKEQGELVDSEIPIIEKMFNKINFRFKSENPTGLYFDTWKFFEKRGTFIYEDYTDSEGNIKQKINRFILSDPDEYNLMVTDHFYLLKTEKRSGQSYSTKQNIDKFSEYQVELKNLFGMSFINLQQFNQGLSSVERAKFKGLDLSPAQGDFRDTTNPYADSDICIGLMCPNKLDMDTCMGYDIKKLKDRMIMFKIIKNRLSRDNIAIGLAVSPKTGTFRELPQPNKMSESIYKMIEDEQLIKK